MIDPKFPAPGVVINNAKKGRSRGLGSELHLAEHEIGFVVHVHRSGGSLAVVGILVVHNHVVVGVAVRGEAVGVLLR